MQRTAVSYFLLVGLATLALVTVLHYGRHLPLAGQADPVVTSVTGRHLLATEDVPLVQAVEDRLQLNAEDALSRFFLQLFVVIVVSYAMGWVFTRCGQPAVVGEMMGGILLGPSLFGWLAPSAFHFVFAANSLEPLRLLSQIGVCLFMFAVGMEMDWGELRQKASSAILVSHVGIAIPCALGAGLAYLLYGRLAQPGALFIPFALFVAISMSITAFPVLVRILQDRRMLKTSLGQFASACAAMGDATAWGLLALVVAFARSGSLAAAAICFGFVLLFLAVMFLVLKPNLTDWLGREAIERPKPAQWLLAIIIALFLASAFCTQLLGIHALFGAFVAGLIMPTAGGFRAKLGVRLENISSVLLLPVFFASSGLRTEVGLLHERADVLICLLIIAVATIAKFGSTFVAAIFAGMDRRASLQLGALMNTRGLMELIALNLGYELHILSQRLFSMLVLMALVTTIMTGPLLSLFGRDRQKVAGPGPLAAPPCDL